MVHQQKNTFYDFDIFIWSVWKWRPNRNIFSAYTFKIIMFSISCKTSGKTQLAKQRVNVRGTLSGCPTHILSVGVNQFFRIFSLLNSREVFILFWMNHFCTHQNSVNYMALMASSFIAMYAITCVSISRLKQILLFLYLLVLPLLIA